MKKVMPQLRPILPDDIPEDLREAWATVLTADAIARVSYPGAPDILSYGRLTPKQRDAWTDALIKVYERLVQMKVA